MLHPDLSPPQESFLALDQEAPLILAYEDRAFIAAYKPAGQLFHGYTKGLPLTLVDQLKQRIASAESKPGPVYLGVVHRLDRAVSGLALLGRNSKVSGRLGEQVQSRSIEKIYLALVEGEVPTGPQRLADRLEKLAGDANDPENPKTEVQDCSLRCWSLGRAGGLSLLAIVLETGRRHQIRRQLALRSWPILGDQTYGASADFPGTAAVDSRFRPIGLHAAALALQHPISYKPLLLRAAVPRFWEEASPELARCANVFLAEMTLNGCGTIEGLPHQA